MQLDALDWAMVALYCVITIAVGLAVARKASSGTQEFFLSGRSLPWYFLGISLVATRVNKRWQEQPKGDDEGRTN